MLGEGSPKYTDEMRDIFKHLVYPKCGMLFEKRQEFFWIFCMYREDTAQ